MATYHQFMDLSYCAGLVIPQKVYANESSDFTPLQTIRFSEDGYIGVRMVHAMFPEFPRATSSHCRMDNAQDRPQVTNTAQKTTIRIEWPGYRSFQSQITVKEQNSERGGAIPVTKAKLAHEVAKAVWRFYADNARTRSMEATPDWHLRSVPFERLVLVELRHVSSGSWQPVLCDSRS